MFSLALHPDGTPSHHVILLPGQAVDVNWPDATAWAATIGGELPTRQEQSLLFANLKNEFLLRAYWSREEHSKGSAWCQHFHHGYQDYDDHSNEFCARAVRRFRPVRSDCGGIHRLPPNQAQQRQRPRIRGPPGAQLVRSA